MQHVGKRGVLQNERTLRFQHRFSIPDTETPWAAVRTLSRFGETFAPVKLADTPEAYEAFGLLVASGCIEARCVVSAKNRAASERLDAELRFSGCPCDPFSTNGKRAIAWHAFDHTGWIDASGATLPENIEIKMNVDARITNRGCTVLEMAKRLKQAADQGGKLGVMEGMLAILQAKPGNEPRILSCRRTAISEARDTIATETDSRIANDHTSERNATGKTALMRNDKKHLRITLCGGSGGEARYIDLPNITHACEGASKRSIRELDRKAKRGEPPVRNGAEWKGPVACAFLPTKDGGISENRLNLYDLENVRAYFGRVDSAALIPRDAYLPMDEER